MATAPPTIATGTAHAGAVPMPTRASAGPAHPPIAAPAVANGTVAAIPTPPVTRPTPDPKTPPATPPIAAPAALIALVAEVPAATIPTAVAAVPPTIVTPIVAFSILFLVAVGDGDDSSASDGFLFVGCILLTLQYFEFFIRRLALFFCFSNETVVSCTHALTCRITYFITTLIQNFRRTEDFVVFVEIIRNAGWFPTAGR